MSGLADEAVAWPSAVELGLPPLDQRTIVDPLVNQTAFGFQSLRTPQDEDGPADEQSTDGVARALGAYARRNAAALGLNPDPKLPIQPEGFHAVFRLGGNGLLKVNVVAQFVQTADKATRDQAAAEFGGIELRGGATVVADVDGEIRHVVSRPTPALASARGGDAAGIARLAAVADFVDQFDSVDLPGPWRSRAPGGPSAASGTALPVGSPVR